MRYRGPVTIVVILALLPAWLGLAASPARADTPWQRPVAEASWLATLNAYRALAAQAPVGEDAAASADCRLHARYIVETNTLQHREDSASPWYTPAGDRAARESDLAAGSGPTAERAALEIWLSAPFHALPLVSPRLATAGYGADTKPPVGGAFGWGGCLNVLRGQTNRPAATRYPVRWPAADGLQPFLTGAIGGEYPDPVGTCGYAYPVGGFVLLQLAEPVRAGTRGALATAAGAGALSTYGCAGRSERYAGS